MRPSREISSYKNTATKTRSPSRREAEPHRATEKAPTRARLTDRDRQLVGVLAIARYLSNEQLANLFFVGRSPFTMRKRLLRLSGEGPLPFRPPYLRRIFYRTYEGHRVEAWALTTTGYAIAKTLLGISVKVPKADVGAAFREHTIILNQLLVALFAPAAGGYPRAKESTFRWIASDSVRLPWKEYVPAQDKSLDRVVVPDAILEIPYQRRRLFLECETGTQSIVATGNPNPGSTLAKVESYEAFICGFADSRESKTFYAEMYLDNWAPEVLFLVCSSERARHINAAISNWRMGRGGVRFPARALTFTEASVELNSTHRKGGDRPADESPSRGVPSSAFLKSEEVAALRRFYNGAVLTLKEFRAKARSENKPPPSYPPDAEKVQAVIERLQRALDR